MEESGRSSTKDHRHHSEERREGDELGILANDLREAICDVMDEERTAADMLPFFAKHAESEKVTYAHFQGWRKSLRRFEYADELVVALAAKELDLCIAVVPKASDWAICWHPPREKVSVQDSVIYLGNDDMHYVCLKVTPLVDRTRVSVLQGKGKGGEEEDAMPEHGSGCSASSQEGRAKPAEVQAGVLQSKSVADHRTDSTVEKKMVVKPKMRDGRGDEPARTKRGAAGQQKRPLEELNGKEPSDHGKGQGVEGEDTTSKCGSGRSGTHPLSSQEVCGKSAEGVAGVLQSTAEQADLLIELTSDEEMVPKAKPRDGCGDESARRNQGAADEQKRPLPEAKGNEPSDSIEPGSNQGLRRLKRYKSDKQHSANEAMPPRWVNLEQEYKKHWKLVDLKSLYRKSLASESEEGAFAQLTAAVQKANVHAGIQEFKNASIILRGAVTDVSASCTARAAPYASSWSSST